MSADPCLLPCKYHSSYCPDFSSLVNKTDGSRPAHNLRSISSMGSLSRSGPARAYWNDFVFEAYLNHRADVVYLAGLPYVPEKTFVSLAGQGRS